jgi:hypothetical protein
MTCLLHSPRAVLTKTVTANEVIPFSNVKTFDLENVEFQSFDDMATILTWLEGEPHRCLIRGEAIAPGPAQHRLLRDQVDGRRATIKPVADGLHWVMLDVDKAPAPAGLADTNEARLAYLLSYLPPVFHDVTTYYQWSSSAGLDGWKVLSAHFYFWCDERQLCSNLHRRADKGDWRNIVDPAPFTPNQVHYTAAPIFEGRENPVGQRSGILKGERDTVDLKPWLEPYRPRPVISAAERSSGISFTAALNEIGKPHYHLPLLRAIAHYIAITPTMQRDRLFCLDAVENACQGSGRSYINNHYLRRVYDDAERKFG